ncbi:MAG: nitrous oxide reductase family maturation protein NosD [Sulfurisoma sp.]|nr:nitrous oxide reductase family maturation protein NosD [Sulfurisoma sp.]
MRLLLLMSLFAPLTWAAPPLQPLLDATPPGGVLRLAPGSYAGPAVITRSLTLDGQGRARIDGGGRGTVLAVRASGVTLRGVTVTGSGETHDGIDAGILIEGDDNVITDNTLEDVLFGIHVKGGNRNRVIGNRVTGKDKPLGLRGDAIRLWNSRHNIIERNIFERARDLTFTHSPDNRIKGNRFHDGRYGMHIIFSPRLVVESNRLEHTGTGIIVLYSPNLIVRGNHVAHAMAGGGGGIVFKESGDALVENNEIIHCAVGLQVDAPPQPVGVLVARGNRFAHNLIGAFFYGESGGHRFENNRFEHNLTQVGVSAVGTGSANVWRGNYWSDYRGFDRDGNGVGDTPHELWLFADRIWMETPATTFFRNSPALELLDFLERLAPFSTPSLLLRDAAPRMR